MFTPAKRGWILRCQEIVPPVPVCRANICMILIERLERNEPSAIQFPSGARAEGASDTRRWKRRRGLMISKRVIFATCAAIVLSAGAANAGPCNTQGKDAGSGPTPGYTGKSITTGKADVKEHPPTA